MTERRDDDLARLLQVAPLGHGTVSGAPGSYPWGFVYGGHLVAQAMTAAHTAVGANATVASAQTTFLRRAATDAPIDYEVTTLRDGRIRTSCAVHATQRGHAVTTSQISFDLGEPSDRVQRAAMPSVEGPDVLSDTSWSPLFDKRVPAATAGASLCAWMRARTSSESPMSWACALAYLSDDLPARAAVGLTGRRRSSPPSPHDWVPEDVVSSTLEHSLWFLDQPAPGEWCLFVAAADVLSRSRAVVRGDVFSQDGRLVASLVQYLLVRTTGSSDP